MQCRIRQAERGFTLVEAMVAAAISALFLSSIFAMNMATMDAIRSARESTNASQALQQRVERLRIANWHEVTDASWLHDNLLNTDAPGASGLRNLVESLTLVPYDSTDVGSTQLTRSNGSATIVSQNSSLLGENAVKVIWSLNYTGAPNDRQISRQIVAILAKGGVAK